MRDRAKLLARTPKLAPSSRQTPSPAMRRFLVHMQECDGWLCEDPIKIPRVVIERAEKLGWANVQRWESGAPCSADITSLGRAAYTWGTAVVYAPA